MIDKGIASALPGADVATAAKAGAKSGKHETAAEKGGFMSALSQVRDHGHEKGKKSVLDGLIPEAKAEAGAGAGDEATPDAAATTTRRSQKPIIDIRTVNVKTAAAEDTTATDATTADAADTVKKRGTRVPADMKDAQHAAKLLEGLDAGKTARVATDAKADDTARAGTKHARRTEKSDEDAEEAASGPEEASAKDMMSMLEADEATPVVKDPAAALPQTRHEAAAPLLAAAAKSANAGVDTTKPASGRTAAIGSKDGAETAASLDMPGESDVDADAKQLFRISRADGKGQTMEMVVGGNERRDQSEAEPRNSQAETVTVLDSRRYLGLAQNSSSLMNTIAGDSEWAKAMQPSSALSNAATMASTGKVVNTLKIQLTPIALGTVTATMRLVGDELSVDLTVETAAAYRQLSDDQKSIVDALRAQGFAVDQVSVTLVAAPDKPDTSNSQTGGQGASFGQQAAQDGSGSASSRRDERHAGQQTSRTDATPAEDGAAGSAGGSGGGRPDHVYI